MSREIQQFLFRDMARDALTAVDILARFRNEATASKDFSQSVLAQVRCAGRGGVVMVGCSPAVSHDLVARDLRKAAGDAPTDAPALCFLAPPIVENARAHLRLLYDRYLAAAGVMNLRAKHEPQYSVPVHRSTEAEALAAMLRIRGISGVIITHAENLLSHGSLKDASRVIRHVLDLARRSEVPHLLVGDRRACLTVAAEGVGSTRLRVSLQPLYDPANKSDIALFAGILNGFQKDVGDGTTVLLAEKTEMIMRAVGGDPCRASRWVCDALCLAASGGQKMSWQHMTRAGPRLSEINEATSELAHFLAWAKFDPLQSASTAEDHLSLRAAPRTKPGERSPVRDPVPRSNLVA